MLRLYNTLSRRKEVFKPINDKRVGLYTCGPTVYFYAHIGNLRTYIFEDVLKRVLLYNNYDVNHIMNITDVGHLTSNADVGEDKLERGARRENKTVWEIANFYEKAFKNDLKRLNIIFPNKWIRATETIKEQIKFIQLLEKKGVTYIIDDGVYFDTQKLKNYGLLWPIKARRILDSKSKKEIEKFARVEMVSGKKNPTDFALWKFTPRGIKRQMEWDSPWNPPGACDKVKGFPGWHTECVAMSIKALGIPFDIHCGGIDHIPIHHTNEIAQAEAVFGKNLAKYWLHGEFLILEKGKRMGKSEGNIIILEDILKKGFSPLSYRYFCFNAHYRSKLLFSWKALGASQRALDNLYQKIADIKTETLSDRRSVNPPIYLSKRSQNYRKIFKEYINNDLDMPKALALIWQVIRDKNLKNQERNNLLIDFDKIFGFGLDKIKKIVIPQEVRKLVSLRERHRKQKEFKKADTLREKIKFLGWEVEDTKEGPKIIKIKKSVQK